MVEIVGELVATATICYVLSFLAAVINGGTPRYDRSEILTGLAWLFLAVGSIFMLVAIWGPVIAGG